MASPVTKWHDVPFGYNIAHLIHSTKLRELLMTNDGFVSWYYVMIVYCIARYCTWDG
jgi:hypothetical protein